MMHIFRTLRRNQAGVAMAEFALVLPILMTLLFGLLDLGKSFNYWIDETHLANEGARWAVVNKNPGPDTLQAYIQQQATTTELREGGSGSVAAPLEVCISFPEGTDVGDPVHVTATTTYTWLGILGLGVVDTTIVGSSTMRLEARPTTYEAGCS
jgi:hypothetical protein